MPHRYIGDFAKLERIPPLVQLYMYMFGWFQFIILSFVRNTHVLSKGGTEGPPSDLQINASTNGIAPL